MFRQDMLLNFYVLKHQTTFCFFERSCEKMGNVIYLNLEQLSKLSGDETKKIMNYEHFFTYKDIIISLLIFFGLLYVIRLESVTKYFSLVIVAIVWFNPILVQLFDKHTITVSIVVTQMVMHFLFIPLFLLTLLIISITEKEDRLFCLPIIFSVFLVCSKATWLYEYNLLFRVVDIWMILMILFVRIKNINPEQLH